MRVDPPRRLPVNRGHLERLLLDALKLGGRLGPCRLGLWVADDEALRELNRSYMAKDYPTDVLSFSYLGKHPGVAPSPRQKEEAAGDLIGEIAISYDRVKAQAREYGHGRARELAYLFVHGVLHILGWDHEKESDRQCMRVMEERLLGSVGIARRMAAEAPGGLDPAHLRPRLSPAR